MAISYLRYLRSCLTPEEPSKLRDLLHEFRDQFNDGTRPLSATNLLKACTDTGNTPPASSPPRRLSPAMREVVRSAVGELDAKGIIQPGVGQLGLSGGNREEVVRGLEAMLRLHGS